MNLGDKITPSLTYQIIIKNFLFKNKMLCLASLKKLKSNTSDSVRLLTCYFTPYTLSIFKISPMSEIFKVPPYKVSNFPGLLLNVVGMGTYYLDNRYCGYGYCLNDRYGGCLFQ